jgi:hypothetical protein
VAEGDAVEPHHQDPHHHGSHQDLLRSGEAIPPAPPVLGVLDAIIVPISTPTHNLGIAIELASSAHCPLVALCSQAASVAEAERLAHAAGIELVAIDMRRRRPARLLPKFRTEKVLARAEFADHRDTGAKRNLGLLLAHLLGWQRVFFLDDDITIPDPDDLLRAAQLLENYDVVGLPVVEYPDNSVVCHINRETGGEQSTFIGGGALAVNVGTLGSMSSFFPKVYNEDWFFLLGDNGLRPSARIGSAQQRSYDPYASERRAEFEEFGDSLAEGVFWLLDQESKLDDAVPAHWQKFLDHRKAFIQGLLDRVEKLAEDRRELKQRMRAALEAALHQNSRISPTLFVDYLQAWRDDRWKWHNHLIAKKKRYHSHPRAPRIRGLVSRRDMSSVDKTSVEKMLDRLGLLGRLGLPVCARYVAPSARVRAETADTEAGAAAAEPVPHVAVLTITVDRGSVVATADQSPGQDMARF